LFSTTTLFTGPLESSVKGVDLSWLMAGVGGGVIYVILTLLLKNQASAGVESMSEVTATS
jgi:hypothetical protein